MNTERDFIAYVEAQLRQVPPLRPEVLSEVLSQLAPTPRTQTSTPWLERRIHVHLSAPSFMVVGVIALLAAGYLAVVQGVSLTGTTPLGAGEDIAFVQASYDDVADRTLRQGPGLLRVASEGGAPVPIIDMPGGHWALGGGRWPDDMRNGELVGPAVRWSPDGTQIAFRLFNDAPGIYLVKRDGSDLRRLVDLPLDRDSGPVFSAALDWSPDGRRIAYTYPYDRVASPLHVVEVEGGEVTDVSGDDPQLMVTRTLDWSPDGTTIAFVRTAASGLPRASRLYLMGADGTNLRELPTGPEPYPQVQAIAWAPDGSSIAFVVDMGEIEQGPGTRRVDAPERGALRTVNPDGTGLRTLLGPWRHGCCEWTSNDQPLAWSPDGTSLAVLRPVGDDADPYRAVVLVGADGTGKRVLASGAWFDWSPDGTRLVVADARGRLDGPPGSYSIHVIEADGSDVRWLADGEYPAWAPTPGVD